MKKLLNNKKAFTLVELLAVISLLSCALLISVPFVIKAVNDSKEDAFKSSVKAIFKSINLYATQTGNNEGTIEDLQLSGQTFLTGRFSFDEENNQFLIFELCDGEYMINNATSKDLNYQITKVNGICGPTVVNED